MIYFWRLCFLWKEDLWIGKTVHWPCWVQSWGKILHNQYTAFLSSRIAHSVLELIRIRAKGESFIGLLQNKPKLKEMRWICNKRKRNKPPGFPMTSIWLTIRIIYSFLFLLENPFCHLDCCFLWLLLKRTNLLRITDVY